jgi:hypothetical protein
VGSGGGGGGQWYRWYRVETATLPAAISVQPPCGGSRDPAPYPRQSDTHRLSTWPSASQVTPRQAAAALSPHGSVDGSHGDPGRPAVAASQLLHSLGSWLRMATAGGAENRGHNWCVLSFVPARPPAAQRDRVRGTGRCLGRRATRQITGSRGRSALHPLATTTMSLRRASATCENHVRGRRGKLTLLGRWLRLCPCKSHGC